MSYIDVHPRPPEDFMRKSEYDIDQNILVDNAEILSDGANVTTAQEVRDHVDDPDIHFEIDDSVVVTDKVWSSRAIYNELDSKSDVGHVHDGSDTILDTSQFNNILSPAENTPQKMADVVDDAIQYNILRHSFRINLKGA